MIGITRSRDDWAQKSLPGTAVRRTPLLTTSPAQQTPLLVSVSALTRSRLLPSGRFYNRDLVGYLPAFFHASDDDQAGARNQQAAMIHCGLGGGLGSVFVDRFPLLGVNVKSESH